MHKNSAHDIIRILPSPLGTNWVKAALKSKMERDVFDVIENIGKAQALGDATLSQKSLVFCHAHTQATIRFRFCTTTERGWLANDPLELQQQEENSHANFQLADLRELERGNFDVTLHPDNSTKSWSLDKLLEEMEIHGIGRPSTFASTLENLEVENDFFQVDRSTADVKLTDIGYRAAALFRLYEPDISSYLYTSELNILINKVEKGECSAKEVILKVYEDVFGEEAREAIEDIAWDDLSQLYENSEEAAGHQGGFLEILTTSENT